MTSPFKFLDAFEKEDQATFFGREAEVEQLYRLIFEASLVLVYGASGTGKTSLIRCGLANRFAATDWFQIFVRRGDDLNTSLDREVRARAETAIPPETGIVDAIRSVYLDHLRPVYLIFDQFEELFILGESEEQEAFFATAASILASGISCKIMISLREEYLASLHRFEQVVPTLFNKRLRVEPMSMVNVEQVIAGMTKAAGVRLEHGGDTARLIIRQIGGTRLNVQLAYLQVYLDTLYNRAVAPGGAGEIVFTDVAVGKTGELGDIMAGFLDDQAKAIQTRLTARFAAVPRDAAAHLLEEFVTVEGTKQPVSRDELAARLPSGSDWLDEALGQFQNARILRKVDDRFELAHDSLALRIADRRSGELKAMMMVKKVVRDRIEAFPQTRTWLNAEEIAIVRRASRQTSGIGGEARFELTAEESRFVRRSIWKRRWRRFRVFGGIVLLILLCVVAGGIMFSINRGEDEVVAMTNATDQQIYGAYRQLIGRTDDASVKLRRRLVEAEAQLNQMDEEILAWGMASEADKFWLQIRDADVQFEEGRRERARAGYLALEQDWRSRLAPENLRARVRLKAIRLRLYTTGLGDGPVEDLRKILELTTPAAPEGSWVDFSTDTGGACFQLLLLKQQDRRCTREAPKPAAGAEAVTLSPS